MANLRRRGSSLFPGLLLLFVGTLLLLHNYRGLDIFTVLGHWWPLILIFWGGIKLYERMAASRSGDPGAAKITAGEVFLVLGLLSLLGIVVAVDYGRENLPGHIREWGNSFDFDLEVAPKSVPADARITIRNGRGNISVRPSDEAQIRISGKKNAKAWNENDAQQIADRAGVEIVQNGDGYEIRPTGGGAGDSRIRFDLDVAVPKKASLTIRNEKGDITVADMAKPVSVTNGVGDIEIRGTAGDVNIDTRKSDIKVSDTKGHVEIFDAPGNLSVRSQDDITLENAGGKVKVENRRGNVEVRFSAPPRDDIEINNSSAGITLSLPDSSSFEIVADCHSGDIDTEFQADSLKQTSKGSSDSHLEGTYGSGR